jgi:hypothetical protein
MKRIRRTDTLNRRNVLTGHSSDRKDACSNSCTVNMHRAGAAETRAASKLGSLQSKLVTNDP